MGKADIPARNLLTIGDFAPSTCSHNEPMFIPPSLLPEHRRSHKMVFSILNNYSILGP